MTRNVAGEPLHVFCPRQLSPSAIAQSGGSSPLARFPHGLNVPASQTTSCGGERHELEQALVHPSYNNSFPTRFSGTVAVLLQWHLLKLKGVSTNASDITQSEYCS